MDKKTKAKKTIPDTICRVHRSGGYQVDRTFSEKISGANKDRPQLKAMLDYVREGDTLYIESISRLGRSTKDLLNIIDTLTEKGVSLVSNTNSNTTQSNIFIVE